MFNRYSFTSINWEAFSAISGVLFSSIAIIISVITLIISRKESIKLSKESNDLYEATNRAILSVYSETIIANSGYFFLIIRNFGKTQAVIQSFETDLKTLEIMKLRDHDFTKSIPNSSLAPGQSLTYLIIDEDIPQDLISTFKISYSSGKKLYTDEFKFNLNLKTKLPSAGISSGPIDKQLLKLYQDKLRKEL